MSREGLSLEAVSKSFRQGGSALQVLNEAYLSVRPGELVALVGPSGAGKSTLLQIAGLLERPDSGQVVIAGQEATKLSESKRTRLRRSALGFVYQYHHLLPEFSARENVTIPQMIARQSRAKARERAEELLSEVGLGPRMDHRPAQLSGGEQQRVAIARALANRPAVLMADEPTGNLDPTTAEDVFRILTGLVRNSGLAALIATHNLELAQRMDRVLRLQDGQVVEGLAGRPATGVVQF